MNLEIENIDSTNENIWRLIYEVIHGDYFKAVKFFPSEFLNQCKYNQNKPQKIPNEVKAAFNHLDL